MMERPALHLRFGAFVLDLSRSALLHEGRYVPLRRQAFDTLRHLVERRGDVVSKEELVEAVWTTRPADPDGSVAQCIKEIRKALGTEARWMIRTVPGTGYEFTAPIEEVATTARGDARPSGARATSSQPPVEEVVPAQESRPQWSEGTGDREGSEIGLPARIREIGRRPVFIGGVALTAGVVLTIAVTLLWSANSQRDAEQESYLYRPIGDIRTGEQVTITTRDGRVMTCIGGQIGRLPRRCWWN
jgi:DNA-binding winged helix-turn-helix (wHTH) protein